MKSSKPLLSFLADELVSAESQEFYWSAVRCDSREVSNGDIFFAIPGNAHNGLLYIEAAVKRGASAVFVPSNELISVGPCAIPVLAVKDIRRCLARAAAYAEDFPSRKLTAIAVTGTNGKTSTAWLIAQLLATLGKPTLLCGTLGNGIISKTNPTNTLEASNNTTADPLTLQRLFRSAVDAGVEYMVMEVTSQGVVQERCTGIDWDVALFTNLTRDHLDMHGTIEAYSAAKFRLFAELLPSSSKQRTISICNIDDDTGAEFQKRIRLQEQITLPLTLSARNSNATFSASAIECTLSGLEGVLQLRVAGNELTEIPLRSRLLGRYNVYNTSSACAALIALGFDPNEVAHALPTVPAVPGRLERVGNKDVYVFVDYAHTPDALTSVLSSVREIGAPKLHCVFGCGGDRDRGKRPLMGAAVAQLADVAFATSDNPRSEDPEQIIRDIIPGLHAPTQNEHFRWKAVVDRKEAIHEAIAAAAPGEVVVVAGKGHEDYQEVQGVKYPFLDREVCAEALNAVGKL